ncbi:unnamed protein product, partial [Allacma fusca]
NGTNVKNDLLNWQPPENFKTKFPYYHSGYDYESRPVIVFEWGKWNTRMIAERGGQEFEDLKKFQDLTVERIKTAYYYKFNNDSDKGTPDNDIVFIADLEGYDLTQFVSLKRFNGRQMGCYCEGAALALCNSVKAELISSSMNSYKSYA